MTALSLTNLYQVVLMLDGTKKKQDWIVDVRIHMG